MAGIGADGAMGPSSNIDVTIVYRTSSKDTVYVSGDFNDWRLQKMNTTDNGVYEYVVNLPSSIRAIRYKFRIGDNTWLHDGTAQAEPDGYGGFNNRLDIPAFPDLLAAQGEHMTETVIFKTPESVGNSDSTSVEGGGDAIDPETEIRSMSSYQIGSEYEIVSLRSDNDDAVSQSEFSVMSDYASSGYNF